MCNVATQISNVLDFAGMENLSTREREWLHEADALFLRILERKCPTHIGLGSRFLREPDCLRNTVWSE